MAAPDAQTRGLCPPKPPTGQRTSAPLMGNAGQFKPRARPATTTALARLYGRLEP
jgi:hypothetical protein